MGSLSLVVGRRRGAISSRCCELLLVERLMGKDIVRLHILLWESVKER